MLKIRFVRVGKKNKPFFRIAVGDSRRTPKGKFIEKLGYYNPLKKEKSINKERVLHWLSNGVQCSDTVHNLLVSLEIIKGPKRKIKIKSKKSADAEITADKKPTDTSAETVGDKQEKKNEEKKEEIREEKKIEETKESADDKVANDKNEKSEVKKEEVKEEKKEETKNEDAEKPADDKAVTGEKKKEEKEETEEKEEK